nr:hypothetical protein [Tanacetum cinerariifolium]
MVAYLSKSDACTGFDQIVDFLNAQVIRKKVVVTEDIIGQDHRLDDADGVECLPTKEIFAELARMEQPTTTSTSDLTLLNTLMETCTTFSHKVSALEQDKVAQALKILKLKRRVKKLKKQRRSKSSGLKRLRKVGRGRIEVIDADEDITLVDMETEVDLGAGLQGRLEEKDEVNVAAKEVNVAEPTVFHNEEMQEKRLDNIKKCQSLKRKPISIAQAKKNMIVYLKNMVGYNIAHFKGMTYDQVRPIFEREYNKVQTFLKPDIDEEPTKKKVAKETLLQESFKKLRAEVEVSGSHSTQDTPTDDPKEMSKEDVKNMQQIIPVSELKVEALQVKYPHIDWEIYSEGSRAYWIIIIVGEITQAYWSFEDMLQDFDREDLDALWRLTKENCGVHQVSSTRRHDIFMFPEKDYPMTDVVLLLILSTKLQVDEDYKMARDLVMKIFMEANKPKSKKSVDTSSKKCTKGLLLLVEVLVLLVQDNVVRQNDTAAEETDGITLMMDNLSEVSEYLNNLEAYLDDGDSSKTRMCRIEKSFEALEHKSVVVELGKHKVVVFTKAPSRDYSKPFMTFTTPCGVDGQEAWDAELDFTYSHNYIINEMLGKLGFVRLDYEPLDRKYKELEEQKPTVEVLENYMVYWKKLDEVMMGRARLENKELGDKEKPRLIKHGLPKKLCDLVLDIPVAKELPLLLGHPFLRTCGEIIDVGLGTMTIDDGFIRHTYFPKPRAKDYLENFEVDEDWLGCFEVGHDEDGNQKYGFMAPSFLDIKDEMGRALAMEAYFNPFKISLFLKGHGVYKRTEGDGAWHTDFEVITPSGRKFKKGFKTKETKRKLSGKFTLEVILNCDETLKDLTKMEYTHVDGDVFVVYSWKEFSLLFMKRAFSIKGNVYPELCKEEHVLTLSEFTVLLGLYEPSDMKHRLFDIHFNNLEINDKEFDHNEYWKKIGETTRTNKRTSLVKDPLMRIVHKLLVGALVHRTGTEYLCKKAPRIKKNSNIYGGHYVTKIAKALGYYVDGQVDKCSDPIECEEWIV